MDAERRLELLATLNHAAFDGLTLVEGPVFVIGHKSPDSDTVCSAIAYAALLRELGFDAHGVVAGPLNRESAYILDAAGVAAPARLDDARGKNVVLVDHDEYSQAVDGMQGAHVVAVADHHNDGSVYTQGPLVYDARPFGSTATIVWEKYLALDVALDASIATVLLGGVLSDTKGLTSGTTTPADLLACDELSRLAGIDDVTSWYQSLYQARISHEGMSDEEILALDYKEYEEAGTTFGVSSIEVYDEDEAIALARRMAAHLAAAKETSRMDFALASIFASRDGASFTYLVADGVATQAVVQKAFGAEATFDGTSFVLRPHASRKQVLVPRLRAAIAQA